LNSGTWTNDAPSRALAKTLLTSTQPGTFNQWYDPTAPRSLGYCNNQADALAEYTAASAPQIADFCNLIDSMLNTIDTPTDIGKQAFCGGFNVSHLFIYLFIYYYFM